MLQMNRNAKTSCLLVEKMASKVSERTKVVFAPTGRIPSFEGEHRGLVCGSVAGRPKSLPLLI
jgi:hypothetical protein